MRVAYADPPYLGCCGLYQHNHADGVCYDLVSSHAVLIERLSNEFPGGWALSCSSPSLRELLALCPGDVRIGAWVKPFAVFKPNVNPATGIVSATWQAYRRQSRLFDPVIPASPSQENRTK